MSVDGWAERSIDVGRGLIGGGPWTIEPLHGTGGGQHTSTVCRLRCADDTAIVKVVQRNDVDADHPSSWRRELDLYRSGWRPASRDGIVTTPTLLHGTTTDEAAVMVLEDVPFDDRAARSTEWYARFAELLGAMAAAPVDPAPPWASRDFVRSEIEMLAATLPEMRRRPPEAIAELLGRWIDTLDRIAEARHTLLDHLEQVPHGLGHLDAFSRNVADVDGALVVIDWAYSGIAPIGADAAGIVAMNAMHADVAPGGLGALRDEVVGGFVRGVSAERADLDPSDLTHTIDILLALRWSAFLAQIHGAGDALPEIAVDVAGRPFETVLAAWNELADLVHPIADGVLTRYGR